MIGPDQIDFPNGREPLESTMDRVVALTRSRYRARHSRPLWLLDYLMAIRLAEVRK